MRRLLTVSVAVAVAAVLVPACGGRDALTIYSGRGENLVGPLLQRFSEDTGTPIDVRYGNSADLALLIAEEAERTPADVFFSQSPGAVGFLAEQRMLAQLPDETLERVDDRFRSPRGLWAGITGRLRVLVYNSELVAPEDLPGSVFEVTEPRFVGRVAVAPQNASFQDFVTAMRQIRGEEATLDWLRKLAANDAQVYPNNNAIVAAVARGEIPMGLVNHYYNHRFLEEDPSLPSRNHVFEDGDLGSLLLIASVSVLEASDDRERALRFVSYLLSKDAQRYFRDETFEYPLGGGVGPSSELVSLSEIELPDYQLDELGAGLERTTELIARSGLED